jgi:hypothetical protein
MDMKKISIPRIISPNIQEKLKEPINRFPMDFNTDMSPFAYAMIAKTLPVRTSRITMPASPRAMRNGFKQRS